MLNFIKSSSQSRTLKLLERTADEVMALEGEFAALSLADLPPRTEEFRARLNAGEQLDDLLPEAFALVRRAVFLVTGKMLYKVQLMGAAALHAGFVAEMKTGEGKTLTAAPSSYLNALPGRGVHVVTVNDYLSRRDAEYMGRIHAALGLTVGAVYSGASREECQAAYACDITYGTASQFGFDYMRDNMVGDRKLCMQRADAAYALIDEVDSVLVDEARTPMIISGPSTLASEQFVEMAAVAAALKPGLDYEVDLELETVSLTDTGFSAAERLLGVEDLSDGHLVKLWLLHKALQARELFIAGRDYVVESGRVLLIDQATGRILPTHSWQDGQHQAVEAKEGVAVTQMSSVYARITYPGYFARYDKLSGMTGTALDASEVFEAVYQMAVTEIPPNRPSSRVDREDMIFATSAERDSALVARVREAHATGQPILVGTTSVTASETVSALLNKAGVAHEMLNATNHHREAEIIAQAGRPFAVTVATSMAGRGTDILLGGDPEKLAASEPELSLDDLVARCQEEAVQVVAAGGLLVLGRERHESRRVDDQLIGRSGRQGDVGESQFYLSLDDDLVSIYGDGAATKALTFASASGPIRSKSITKLVKRAQEHLSNLNDQQRATTLRFDLLYNAQREAFYRARRDVLDVGSRLKEMFADATAELAEKEVRLHVDLSYEPELVLEHINAKLGAALSYDVSSVTDSDRLVEIVTGLIDGHFAQLRDTTSETAFWQVAQTVALVLMDRFWQFHLLELDALEDAVGLRRVSGTDPMNTWIKDGDALYEEMWVLIGDQLLRTLATIRPAEKASPAPDSAPDGEAPGQVSQDPTTSDWADGTSDDELEQPGGAASYAGDSGGVS